MHLGMFEGLEEVLLVLPKPDGRGLGWGEGRDERKKKGNVSVSFEDVACLGDMGSGLEHACDTEQYMKVMKFRKQFIEGDLDDEEKERGVLEVRLVNLV
jgi:hypothetical protein